MISVVSLIVDIGIISAALQGLGGLGTLVLAILYYYQYGSMEEQTKIQTQQADLMELQFRPHLLVREIDPESDLDGHEILKLHLINAGKDLANDLHVRCDARVGIEGEMIDLVETNSIPGEDRAHAFRPAMAKLRRQPRGDIARDPLAQGGMIEADESAWFGGEIHFQTAGEVNFEENDQEMWQGQPFSETIDELRDLGVGTIQLQFSIIYRDIMNNIHVKVILTGSTSLDSNISHSETRSLEDFLSNIGFRSGSFGMIISEEEVIERVRSENPFPMEN